MGLKCDMRTIFSAQCAAWSSSVRLEFFQRKLSPGEWVSAPGDPCPLHRAVGCILIFPASGTQDHLLLHTSNNAREKTGRLVGEDSKVGSSTKEKWSKASLQRMSVQLLFFKDSCPHKFLF